MPIPRPERNTLLLVLVVGSLLTLATLWFLDNFEYDFVEARSEVSPEARRNRLLAAERFLQRIGLEAEGRSGREFLLSPPGQPGTLLVHRLGIDLPPEAGQRLIDWIGSGGHLILTPGWGNDEEEGDGNRLLERFEVWADSWDPDPDVEEAPGDAVEVWMADGSGPLRVDFNRWRVLQYGDIEPEWQVEGNGGSHLLQFRYGLGQLSVVSDNDFFANDEIGREDHAAFLAGLVGDRQPVWLLYSSNMPSLPELLWKAAPWLLLSAAGLLLLWVWNQWARLGPPMLADDRVRRNLLEHLDAAADYAWRIDRGLGMVTRSREEIEQGWRRRHPALERLDPGGRAAWIAEHTGISAAAVFSALYREERDERRFIRDTLVQQRLAEALDLGTRRDQG